MGSAFGAGGYTLGAATSLTGATLGPWRQEPEPLYTTDGGNGMAFRTFDGALVLSPHRPNRIRRRRDVGSVEARSRP